MFGIPVQDVCVCAREVLFTIQPLSKARKTRGPNSARNDKTTSLLSLRGTKCRAPSHLRNVLQGALLGYLLDFWVDKEGETAYHLPPPMLSTWEEASRENRESPSEHIGLHSLYPFPTERDALSGCSAIFFGTFSLSQGLKRHYGRSECAYDRAECGTTRSFR